MEKVRERLLRATAALEKANIPYAVIGGNAVAAWVSRVDESAVRNTQDVDLLIQRSDLEAATKALEAVGFKYRHVRGIDMFLDGPKAKARDAIHLLFSGEKVRPEYPAPAPNVNESEAGEEYRIVTLEALARMKLTSFRLKDQVHLQDMVQVGLLDATWCSRFPPELGSRLAEILANPEK